MAGTGGASASTAKEEPESDAAGDAAAKPRRCTSDNPRPPLPRAPRPTPRPPPTLNGVSRMRLFSATVASASSSSSSSYASPSWFGIGLPRRPSFSRRSVPLRVPICRCACASFCRSRSSSLSCPFTGIGLASGLSRSPSSRSSNAVRRRVDGTPPVANTSSSACAGVSRSDGAPFGVTGEPNCEEKIPRRPARAASALRRSTAPWRSLLSRTSPAAALRCVATSASCLASSHRRRR
ncbi:hypothetical protein B0H13DRAFT_292445 [Mycena leptocephala]|nr:hypothetical protein B0H13DRAFT_292445 [Mycena leptocephala]